MSAFSSQLQTIFSSKRLVYRSLESSESDREFMYEALQSNPTLNAHTNPVLLTPQTRAAAGDEVDVLINDSLLAVLVCLPSHNSGREASNTTSSSSASPATLTRSTSGKPVPIGLLMLGKPRHPAIAHWRETYLGISIAAPYQSQGYGTEAVDWGVGWAFRFAGVHRVSVNVVAINTRSAAIYRKLGFAEEGCRREVIYMDLQWYDVLQFGLIDHEWRRLQEDRDND